MALSIPDAATIAQLPPDGGDEFNRLVFEKSPYLLQHARNPVDWYPWSDAAFAKARAENKPVFLSVGYSTCHWCHVMEHESFENDDVAAILNEHFVSIKVDREERPDIDEIYMNATMVFAQGRGGWPNSVWLTPDAKPFFAGTYFPREDRGGYPGFKSLLKHLHQLWVSKRLEVQKQADAVAEALKQLALGDDVMGGGAAAGQAAAQAAALSIAGSAGTAAAANLLTREPAQRLLQQFERSFDSARGGFGGPPKFPPHQAFDMLFHEHRVSKKPEPLAMATKTLDEMAYGGIRDHVGGGFHRYATDEDWFLPHFEKMGYDNAQLAYAYVEGWRLTGKPLYREVAESTLDWVLRDLVDPAGGFHSAYDADSEGEEGKFYLWSIEELVQLLGEEDAVLVAGVYNCMPEGNYAEEATGHRPGTNILFLGRSWEELGEAIKVPIAEVRRRLNLSFAKLLEARARRVWPLRDDKVLASWNGLMIRALAHAGRHLQVPRYTEAARRAADFILANMYSEGRLLASWRGGPSKLNAYLDDYAFLADGLLSLFEATGEGKYLDSARELMATLERRFADREGGGFFFTSDDHEKLLVRSKDPYDKAIPAGNGIAARVYVRLAHILGDDDSRERARRHLSSFFPIMQAVPRGAQSLIYALALFVDGPQEPVVKAPTPKQAPEPVAAKVVELAADAASAPDLPKRPRADASGGKGAVKVDVFLAREAVAPGQKLQAALWVTIGAGFHINAATLPAGLVGSPTSLTLATSSSVTLADVAYPEAQKLRPVFDPKTEMHVYTGGVWIVATLELKSSARAGESLIPFVLSVQACDDTSCLAPESIRVEARIEVDPRAKDTRFRHESLFAEAGATLVR